MHDSFTPDSKLNRLLFLRAMTNRKPLPVPQTLDANESLDRSLEFARTFYARALANLVELRNANTCEGAAAWRLLFERVAHDAVWAVTELHRGAETKYFRQRFISKRVYDLWSKASTRRECVKGVQHEHVLETRKIKLKLAEGQTVEDFCSALSLSVACVVVVDEHDKLNRVPNHLEGWERYREAKIAVWDRVEKTWHKSAAQPAAD